MVLGFDWVSWVWVIGRSDCFFGLIQFQNQNFIQVFRPWKSCCITLRSRWACTHQVTSLLTAFGSTKMLGSSLLYADFLNDLCCCWLIHSSLLSFSHLKLAQLPTASIPQIIQNSNIYLYFIHNFHPKHPVFIQFHPFCPCFQNYSLISYPSRRDLLS